METHKRPNPQKLTKRVLRRMVEGQIVDFLKQHPEAIRPTWLTMDHGKLLIVKSLSKRIVGDLAAKLELK